MLSLQKARENSQNLHYLLSWRQTPAFLATKSQMAKLASLMRRKNNAAARKRNAGSVQARNSNAPAAKANVGEKSAAPATRKRITRANSSRIEGPGATAVASGRKGQVGYCEITSAAQALQWEEQQRELRRQKMSGVDEWDPVALDPERLLGRRRGNGGNR